MERKKVKKYPIYSKDIARLKNECDYLILLSNRNTAKSYSTKEYLIKNAFDTGEEFAYLRRMVTEVKDIDVNDYYTDIDIPKITKGEYDCINVFRKRIYFAKIEDNRVVNKKKIGYVFDLFSMEHKKSLMYPKITSIVYEEFVTDNYYLPNEPDLLQNFISSIFRDRKGFVILIGNKISKFNPYYTDWNLHNAPKQATDTIDTYEMQTLNGNVVTIKMWNIKPREEQSGMFFGNSARNIDGDTYKIEEQNKLDDKIENYNVIYNVVVKVQKIKYLMQFLQHRKDTTKLCWYVVPKTTDIQKDTRIVSDEFSTDILTTKGFIPLNENEKMIFNYIKNDKICFVNNMIGTEFKQALKFLQTI